LLLLDVIGDEYHMQQGEGCVKRQALRQGIFPGGRVLQGCATANSGLLVQIAQLLGSLRLYLHSGEQEFATA
jgi:hypothetical protein